MTQSRGPGGGTAAARGSAGTRLLAVIAVVLVLEALRIARPVALSVAAAIFVLMVAWPLEPWLERRVPRWIALAGTFLVVLIALALFLAALTWCAQLTVERVLSYREKLDYLYRLAESYGARFGIELSPSVASGGRSRLLPIGLRTGYEILGFIVLAVAFVALGLGEVHDLRERVGRRLKQRQSAELLRIAGEIATAFRRYFAAKTLTSVLTGIASGLLALVLGLDLAVVWGFAAFLLEYVPTIGSIIAVAPPTLFAFLQFDGITRPLVTFACFAVLQIAMGNIVDPHIEGRVLAFSPVIILLSITLWGWLWGVAGALLGVPMTVAVTIACQHFESTRWIADLVTEGDVRAPGGDDG